MSDPTESHPPSVSQAAKDAMHNAVRPPSGVPNVTLYAEQVIQAAIDSETARLTEENVRLAKCLNRTQKLDGDWLDEWGSCRVCGGEIPHGHQKDCHIFKMEQKEMALEARAKTAEAEVELSRIQMAAIMTATVQNTEKSIKDRIDRSSPYWTQAYTDVCSAIDREMALRVERDALRVQAVQLRESFSSIHSKFTTVPEEGLKQAVVTDAEYENDANLLSQTESLASLCVCGKDELEQLRKDRERLDWIDRNPFQPSCGVSRSAIDAAISAEAKGRTT